VRRAYLPGGLLALHLVPARGRRPRGRLVYRAKFLAGLHAGQPAIYRSSPPVQRAFCARCGTPLTYRHDDWAGQVDVTIGSLDEPARVAPVAHIWMQDAPSWDRPGDGLPSHPRTPRDAP